MKKFEPLPMDGTYYNLSDPRSVAAYQEMNYSYNRAEGIRFLDSQHRNHPDAQNRIDVLRNSLRNFVGGSLYYEMLGPSEPVNSFLNLLRDFVSDKFPMQVRKIALSISESIYKQFGVALVENFHEPVEVREIPQKPRKRQTITLSA